MEATIKLYSSDQPAARAFAQVLAENLSQPVQVCSLSQLPSPDTHRPTKQQLRSERAALIPAMAGLNENIRLAEDSPNHLSAYLPELHKLRVRYEERLTTIEQLLAAPAQERGAADA